MDATTADIYLRSERDPKLIVGRPTIYAIKDVWGRFLYSVTATFERPSYWGAAIALENALVNKVDYCAQYGVPIRQSGRLFSAGETAGGSRRDVHVQESDHLVTGLGVRIGTLPPGRGDLKGIIEQQFRLLNLQCISWLPGALPRFAEDKDTNERLEFTARFTISEFRRLLMIAVKNYHRTALAYYKPSEDVIASGIELSPIELLKWGLVNRSGLSREFPLQEARYHLLPHDEAKITESGVRLNGVHYTCERAVLEKWFEHARSYGIKPLQVAYDPRRVDCIYFQATKGGLIEELVLTTADQRFRGWTWEEVVGHRKEKLVTKLESRHDDSQKRMDGLAAAKEITALANARHDVAMEANPSQSKASQLSCIRENSAAEKAGERASSFNSGNVPQPAAPAKPVPDNIIQLPGREPTPKPAARPVESPFLRKQREAVERFTKTI